MITWEEFKTNKKYWVWAGIIVILLCMFCGGRDGRNENKNENSSQNVITITGHGEVQAVPDIANISLTIRKDAKTVKDAQTQVAEIEAKVLESLKANNILDADRKTVNVSFNPKYEYNTGICTTYNCPNKSVIVGYEAYESIDVKIRKIDDTGKIIQDLGALGVTELSGPNFAVDKEDTLKMEARRKATYTKLEKKEDGQIIWDSMTAAEIERRSRALFPWPGIYTYFKGKKIELFDIFVKPNNLKPGHVSMIDQEVLIGTKKGSISPASVKLEGKTKIATSDFICGYQDFVGTTLGKDPK